MGLSFHHSSIIRSYSATPWFLNAQESNMEDDIDRKEPRNKALEEYTEGFLTSHGVIFSSDFRSPKKRRGKLISSRDRRRERMIYSRGPRVVDKAEDAEDSTNTQNSQNSSNNSFDRNDNRETDFSAGSVSVSAGGGSGGPRASGARGVSQGNAAENHLSFKAKITTSIMANQKLGIAIPNCVAPMTAKSPDFPLWIAA